MTQILPCGLDLAWLLMVQLVISPVDAGRGKANERVPHRAGGVRWESTSYLELLETLNAFICPESRQHWRLWKRKLSPISITHQPICGWRVVAGSVPAGEAAVCPVAATQRDSLQRAEDTAVGGGYVDLGWVGFPPQGALQRCSFPKCCNFCLAPWTGRFGCFITQEGCGQIPCVWMSRCQGLCRWSWQLGCFVRTVEMFLPSSQQFAWFLLSLFSF